MRAPSIWNKYFFVAFSALGSLTGIFNTVTFINSSAPCCVWA